LTYEDVILTQRVVPFFELQPSHYQMYERVVKF